MTDPDGAEPGRTAGNPPVQARYDPEGALQRPAGGSPAPAHAVRLIDLPQYDTARAPIEKRLKAFLTELRKRRLLLAWFRDLQDWERRSDSAPAPPYDWEDLGGLAAGPGCRVSGFPRTT